MFYKFEVDGVKAINSDSSDGQNASIRELVITSDTKDPHVVERSSSVLLKVSVKFLINAETKEQCKEFMKWSLETKGATVYRTVKIDVIDDTDEPIRSFKIPKMFCEDYIENYFENSNANEHSYALLTLIQKTGNFADVENEAG